MVSDRDDWGIPGPPRCQRCGLPPLDGGTDEPDNLILVQDREGHRGYVHVLKCTVSGDQVMWVPPPPFELGRPALCAVCGSELVAGHFFVVKKFGNVHPHCDTVVDDEKDEGRLE